MKRTKPPIAPIWSLYVLECEDGSFYTGIARDPLKRFEAHRQGKGGAYTKSHRPRTLRVIEPVGSHGQALRREWQVKQLSKKDKIRFVADPSRFPHPH